MKQERQRRARLAIWLAGILATVFVGGTVFAPLLDGAGSGWGNLLRMGYSPMCHQDPERSLSIGSGSQAVCARCSGLYLGGALGLFAGAVLFAGGRLRPRPRWLLVAAAPTVIDALFAWSGLPALPNGPRLLLALPVGLVGALFLAVALGDLFSNKTRTRVVPHDPRALEESNG